MLGAIIGDISGSFREFTKKNKYPELGILPDGKDLPTHVNGKVFRYGITDDSILTIATADSIIRNHTSGKSIHEYDFAPEYYAYGNKYKNPIGGFGGGFLAWVNRPTITAPYNSCGNGSAMRVSPVAYFAITEEECLEMAFRSAIPTHNHPDGIKGAQATALSIYLAQAGYTWEQIKSELEYRYLWYEPIGYLGYFDAICQDTMRLVNYVLDNSDSFESAVLMAVTIQEGDSDTIGAIVGSIAEVLYGIPNELKHKAIDMVPPDLYAVLHHFYCFNGSPEFPLQTSPLIVK